MLKVLSCFLSLTELGLLTVLILYTRKPNISNRAKARTPENPQINSYTKANREDGRRSHELGGGVQGRLGGDREEKWRRR